MLQFWDLENLKCVQTLQGHNGTVQSLAFYEPQRKLFSGSHDQTIKVNPLALPFPSPPSFPFSPSPLSPSPPLPLSPSPLSSPPLPLSPSPPLPSPPSPPLPLSPSPLPLSPSPPLLLSSSPPLLLSLSSSPLSSPSCTILLIYSFSFSFPFRFGSGKSINSRTNDVTLQTTYDVSPCGLLFSWHQRNTTNKLITQLKIAHN